MQYPNPDKPELTIEYSIFNHLKIGIIAQLKFFAIKSTKIITKMLNELSTSGARI